MRTEHEATIRRWKRKLWGGLLLAFAIGAGPAPAAPQQRHPGFGRRAPVQREARRHRQPRSQDQHRHAPGFYKRLRDLPPGEQERVLANDERFRRLPPERQQIIRERLRKWNSLSPEQRDRIRERQEIFEGLSPQQRQEARALYQQWRLFPPDRRKELVTTFRQLRDLPPNERERFLSSPDIRSRYSPEEQNLLGGLSRLLPESRRAEYEEPEE